jgi:hypothetical protein
MMNEVCVCVCVCRAGGGWYRVSSATNRTEDVIKCWDPNLKPMQGTAKMNSSDQYPLLFSNSPQNIVSNTEAEIPWEFKTGNTPSYQIPQLL